MLCSCRLKKKNAWYGWCAAAELYHPLPLFSLHKCSASVGECQWVPVIQCGGVQWHTFAFSAHQCQSPFCLPLSCFLSHNNMWWSTCGKVQPLLLYPTAVSAFVGQHNQIGGTAFRATLLVGLLFCVPLHACSSWNYLAMPCLVLSDILILN